MKRFQLVALRKKEFEKIEYRRVYWENFDYSFFKKILTIRQAGRGTNDLFNDVIIGADTETSKKRKNDVEIVTQKNGNVKKKIIAYPNHVTLWTISVRVYGCNIVTLYGRKPSDMVRCMKKIHNVMTGDKTIFYFHNWAYDYVFLKKFMFKKWGFPCKVLNIKPHYPLFTYFDNGIMIKDSLALAQRSLDRWSNDLDIEHKKLTGQYDYNAIVNQNDPMPDDQLEYAEFDTLALCECIEKTMENLGKYIYSIPYTATGIVRELVRKEGKKHNAHDTFLRRCLTFDQYQKMLKVYHGGYTHANRHKIGQIIRGIIKCFDFASSYPFVLLTEKYPDGKFRPFRDCTVEEILEDSDKYAYIFKLVIVNYNVKDDNVVMPPISISKCIDIVNPVCDNGRVLSAKYLSIYINEIDLDWINRLSKWDFAKCVEVECTHKSYLPRWFTDLVFSLFERKTKLKPEADINPVAYALAKAMLNSLYGLCCQRSIRDVISEIYETGEFIETENMTQEAYDKYMNSPSQVLNYQTGVWCTSYAQRNLFVLCNTCTNPEDWAYSDTDSGYSTNWDEDAILRYNNECKRKLNANGYGCVVVDGREYWLGVAEHEPGKDEYVEFVVMGAKRYCGRQVKDGQLHITVAGVPKRGALSLKDNIENFQRGFIFDGETSGKKTHAYIQVDDIYTDENGNETGDSIDLYECDYELDDVTVYNWDDIIMYKEESLQVYE